MQLQISIISIYLITSSLSWVNIYGYKCLPNRLGLGTGLGMQDNRLDSMQEPRCSSSGDPSKIKATVSSMLSLVSLSLLLFPSVTSAALQSDRQYQTISEQIPGGESDSNLKVKDSEVLTIIDNLDIAALFIKDHCTQILSAVKNSGRCLYRGETLSGKAPVLLSPDFDLLDSLTYSSLLAADYFSYVDETMKEQGINSVHPSIAHIGTPDPIKAKDWGPVCSIWPVDALHYAYFSAGEKVFWNDQWGTAESKRDQIFWHNRQKMAKFLNTDVQLTVDEGLEQALIEGREVLFTSNIADSYVFSSPDMALTILIKDSVEKKVGSNKVFTDISRFH